MFLLFPMPVDSSCPLSVASSSSLTAALAAPAEWSLSEMWDTRRVARALACGRTVARAVALGTVFACELRPAAGGGAGVGGYYSTESAQMLHRLRARGVYGRPLGNVLYFMVSPLSEKGACDALLDALVGELEAEEARRAKAGPGDAGAGAVAHTPAREERAQPLP